MKDMNTAIAAYIEKFNEGPPIFEMEEEAAIKAIQHAIDTGEPIEEGAEANLPDGALL